MTDKKKNILLIVMTIFIGLLCVGGTYAYLTFSIDVTNATYNGVTSCFNIDYTAGDSITGTLFQSSTPKGGLSGSVAMNINSACSVDATGTIYLNVESTTGSKLFENNALKYAVYENVNSEPVSSGNITKTGDITLYTNFNLSHTTTSYYVYIWLDGNIADNSYVNIPFSGYIHASATQID